MNGLLVTIRLLDPPLHEFVPHEEAAQRTMAADMKVTLGFSRDDTGKFLPEYLKRGIYERDPFRSIDQKGVGLLVEMAVKKGREVRPDIEVGICGEHGGDPTSIGFFHRAGLDYVSCSPFRVPIARLAAAQAAIGG